MNPLDRRIENALLEMVQFGYAEIVYKPRAGGGIRELLILKRDETGNNLPKPIVLERTSNPDGWKNVGGSEDN
jgi:hypothetical protein